MENKFKKKAFKLRVYIHSSFMCTYIKTSNMVEYIKNMYCKLNYI